MANSAVGPLARHSSLGDRVHTLALIGDPARPLGPEAAVGVSVSVLPLARHWNVRVDVRTGAREAVEATLGVQLPGPSSWCAADGERTVVWLGPDEWLVTEPSEHTSIEQALREAVSHGSGAVVEQTGQRVSLLVQGEPEGLLAKGTGLNLSLQNFAPGRALQGYLAQAIVTFLSRDDGIEVLVRSSFARYVADWLLDAAAAPLANPASRQG